MSTLSTDRQILKCIYEMYARDYPGPMTPSGKPENDPYIAIDIEAIASRLNDKAEMVFGRLYYHLDYQHRYKQGEDAMVHLFALKVGDKRHAIHFPYLASILARANQDHLRQNWTLAFSIVAIVLSSISLIADLVRP